MRKQVGDQRLDRFDKRGRNKRHISLVQSVDGANHPTLGATHSKHVTAVASMQGGLNVQRAQYDAVVASAQRPADVDANTAKSPKDN